ncbi:MAG TPA: hypothetical protein VFO69_05545 [Allosphingosinicella sp.]|nr:hypothetical protein [Allosphingosinicella sp.]
MNPDELAYHRERTQQEEDAARAASCEPARQRHLELAALHRARCEPGPSTLAGTTPPVLHMTLSNLA